jgi:hypothetical protein
MVLPLLAQPRSMRLKLVNFLLQPLNPLLDRPSLCLQLRFPWPSRPNAAAQPRHGFSPSAQTRHHILKLRQFDLKLTRPRLRSLGKNI